MAISLFFKAYKRKHLVSALILMVLTFNAIAQQDSYTIRNIQHEYFRPQQGISSRTVSSLAQDAAGMVWIAGTNGLDISDGVRFNSFDPAPDTLDPGAYLCLHSKDEFMFAGTENGLFFIDIHTRESEFFLPGHRILSIASQDSRILVGTQSALFSLELSENLSLSLTDSIGIANCNDILILKDQLWLATNKGLWGLKGESRPVRLLAEVLPDTLWSLASFRYPEVLLASAEGMFFIDLENETFSHIRPSSLGFPAQADQILSLACDNDSLFYAGTSGAGILRVNPASKSPLQAVPGIDDLFIYDLEFSNDGSLWIGTAWNGLYLLSLPERTFLPYPAPSNTWDFAYRTYYDDYLVIGDFGILRFVEDNTGTPVLPGSISAPIGLRSILEDTEGEFLLAGAGLELYRLTKDFQLQTEYRFHGPPPYSEDLVVQDLLSDKKGGIWACTNLGLCRLDKASLTEQWFFYADDTLATNFYCSTRANNGDLYFGSHAGMFHYHALDKNWRLIRREKGQEAGLSINRITALLMVDHADATLHDYLWAGTLGAGLNWKGPESDGFRHLTKSDGLSDNVITSIAYSPKTSTIWVSTNNGLNRLQAPFKQTIRYSSSSGLPGDELNIGASFIDHKGRIWIGGRRGFSVSREEEVKSHPQGPPVFVKSLRISGLPAQYAIFEDTHYKLRPGQSSISIEFGSSSFRQASRNRYIYMLENWDHGSTEVGIDQASVTYRRLKPGIYHFHLQAIDPRGVQTHPEQILRLSFEIMPPWYQRWWFRSAAIILPLGLIALFWTVRLRRLRKRHALQMQVMEMEKQALRLQMNPHFIFNALNSIQGFIVKGNNDEAVLYLGKFSHLMRLILNNSRESFVTLDDELSALNHYIEIEQLRFSNRFDFELEVHESIDVEFTGISPMLIQPYVENAILHGLLPKESRGSLSIRIHPHGDDELRIEVEDDGIGRRAAEEKKKQSRLSHKSKGMLITRERLELLNEQYDVDARVEIEDLYDGSRATGTRVIIYTICKEL